MTNREARDAVEAKLAAPLDPAAVSVLTFGGRRAPYLEGWYVISAANGIFGFDGWSHEVLSVESMGPNLYMARVRVTVLGVERVDVGTGIAAEDTAQAHETAIKGAATDGLKRALRTFGAQFGNDLYDKNAGAPQTPPQRPQERRSASRPTGEAVATGAAGFATVGTLLNWALETHGLRRQKVLDILGASSPEAIDLDTAQTDIEAALGVTP